MVEKPASRGEIFVVDDDPAVRETLSMVLSAGAYQVKPGEVWLLSGHDPRSFDSRYFGSVPAVNVQGVARPVWVGR